MRTFVTFSRTATTSPAFPKKGLASHTGRLDVIARMLRTALWTEEGIRKDTNFVVTLGGPPNPPLTLFFKGRELEADLSNERLCAEAIRACMKGELKGCKAERKGFEEALRGIGLPVYLLSEDGEDVWEATPKLPAAWGGGGEVWEATPKPPAALGWGPQHDVELPPSLEAKRISLGPKSYLASHCISYLHYVLDLKA